MKLKKIKTDRVLGISAMIISILTLIIFIYQTNIMREQSKLSVKPRLDFSLNQISRDSTIEIQEIITNKGLGPAIIDSIYILHKGKTYPVNIPKFVETVFPELNSLGDLTRSLSFVKGSTLLQSESQIIYSYRFSLKQYGAVIKALEMVDEEDSPFEIKAIYTSIYEDEFWMASNESNAPIKINR